MVKRVLVGIDRDGTITNIDYNFVNDTLIHPLTYLGCECSKTEELCDGVDNDCDVEIDEGCDCINGEENTCINSLNLENVQHCISGVWSECIETCGNDGLDFGETCSNCPLDATCPLNLVCCDTSCTIPECNSNSECDDLNISTDDTCVGVGVCGAGCVHEIIVIPVPEDNTLLYLITITIGVVILLLFLLKKKEKKRNYFLIPSFSSL